jgi:hypothetical protein
MPEGLFRLESACLPTREDVLNCRALRGLGRTGEGYMGGVGDKGPVGDLETSRDSLLNGDLDEGGVPAGGTGVGLLSAPAPAWNPLFELSVCKTAAVVRQFRVHFGVHRCAMPCSKASSTANFVRGFPRDTVKTVEPFHGKEQADTRACVLLHADIILYFLSDAQQRA